MVRPNALTLFGETHKDFKAASNYKTASEAVVSHTCTTVPVWTVQLSCWSLKTMQF